MFLRLAYQAYIGIGVMILVLGLFWGEGLVASLSVSAIAGLTITSFLCLHARDEARSVEACKEHLLSIPAKLKTSSNDPLLARFAEAYKEVPEFIEECWSLLQYATNDRKFNAGLDFKSVTIPEQFRAHFMDVDTRTAIGADLLNGIRRSIEKAIDGRDALVESIQIEKSRVERFQEKDRLSCSKQFSVAITIMLALFLVGRSYYVSLQPNPFAYFGGVDPVGYFNGVDVPAGIQATLTGLSTGIPAQQIYNKLGLLTFATSLIAYVVSAGLGRVIFGQWMRIRICLVSLMVATGATLAATSDQNLPRIYRDDVCSVVRDDIVKANGGRTMSVLEEKALKQANCSIKSMGIVDENGVRIRYYGIWGTLYENATD